MSDFPTSVLDRPAEPSEPARPAGQQHHGSHWAVLIITAVVQLMIVLDATIVNIALPKATTALGINAANRQWILTAYTLAFGGLLLLGGRLADRLGRKRMFLIGMLGFAAASALGGASQDQTMLFAARALQGAFGAILAPAGLSILTVTYTEERDRARAFAVYGGIAAGGAAIGLVLGGVLTSYLNWRWCLFVNTPVAIIAAFFAIRVISESKAELVAKGYDILGTVLGTVGLVSLVYGFSLAGENAEKHASVLHYNAWAHWSVWAFIVGGLVLLVAFVVTEARSSSPIMPLRIPRERNRGGAYLTSVLIGAGLFGSFLFLTIYFQEILHYTPIRAGLASLPTTGGVFVAAGIASQLVLKIPPRWLMALGAVVAAVAMVIQAQISPSNGFLWPVLPGEILLGFGLGMVFVPLQNVALTGIGGDDAGVAAAVLNATQQVGGAIGTGLLNTIAVAATATYIAAHGAATTAATSRATTHGFDIAFYVGAALILAGAVIVAISVNVKPSELEHVDPVPAA